MHRPVLHDQRFAMTDDLRAHIKALEEYATWLEGGRDEARAQLRSCAEDLARVRAGEKATVDPPKPAGFGGLSEAMDDFFGSRGHRGPHQRR